MRISKAIKNNSGIISHMFGGLSNIIATTEFNKVMEDLGAKEKEIGDANKFADINRRLFTVQLGDDDLIKQEETFNPSADYQNMKSYKDWSVMFPNAGPMQKTYQDFLKEQKGLYNDDYSSVYTVNKTPLNKDEITAKRFEKAGLNPEDAIFYNDYIKKKGDIPVDFNRDLTNMITENAHLLRSRGSLGDTKLIDATNRAQSLMQKEKKPTEWGVTKDSDDNLIMYNKRNPEENKIISKKTEKPTVDKNREAIIKSIGFRIEEEKDEQGNPTGKYSYYIPTENGWEKTSLDATKDEYDKYIDKLNTYDEKLGIKNSNSSSRSSRKNRKSVGFQLPKMPEEYKNIKVEDVSKMTLSQLKNITSEDGRKLVSEDVYKAAKDRIRGGNVTDDIEGDDIGNIEGNKKYEEGSFLKDKTRKISEKILSNKDRIDDINEQKKEVAQQLVIFKNAFNSKKYNLEKLNNSVLKYLDDLVDAGYDDEVIEEAKQLFENFKSGK